MFTTSSTIDVPHMKGIPHLLIQRNHQREQSGLWNRSTSEVAPKHPAELKAKQ